MDPQVMPLLVRIDERLDRMEVTQAEQKVLLTEHMRRTDALEDRVEQVAKEQVPLRMHVAVVGALGKVLAVVGTLIGIAVGIMKLLE